jgi:tetratricopeptide (TPR) repeat protein
MRVALAGALLLCVGCGEKEPAPAPAPTAAVQPVVGSPAAAKPATATPAGKRTMLNGAQVGSYRSLLRDGRRQVQAKEYAAGIALYEKALALRPGDPRLLVELGWAAFLAGDLERASVATVRALAGLRDQSAKGAALYNLGRIAEQRGKKEDAAAFYRESLAARPNAVVEKRLAGIGGEAVAAAIEPPTELGPLAGPFATLDAVCAAEIPDLAGEGGKVGCAQDAAVELAIAEGPLKRALLLPVWRSYFDASGPDDATEVARYLVVETDAGFFRTRTWVSFVYNPGAFGIYEELESSLELRDLIPGAPREIVMRAKHQRTDSDLGILEAESEESEWLLVCGLADGAPRCFARIPLRHAYERDVMQLDGGEGGEPVEHTPGLPIRESYDFAVAFDGKGGYALTEIAPPVGDAAARDGARAGSFPLR